MRPVWEVEIFSR